MKLVIIHYHSRPGGVRRVIELATPYLVKTLQIDSVTMAAGEAPDLHWKGVFTKLLGRIPVEFRVESALGYFSEGEGEGPTVLARVRNALAEILDGSDAENCVVWAHNLSLARNALLSRALIDETSAHGITLMAHHHDWWFDNRWQRWPELRRAGFSSLDAAAEVVFPTQPNIRHVAINQADAAHLERFFGRQAGWLPNLIDPPREVSLANKEKAQCWLRDQLGDEGPVWILPCRLLRRKNVAEALLLTRWLRPEAWLVTTGGVSSADEQDYAGKLGAAAEAHGWRVRLGILRGAEADKPAVSELLAASEAVVLSSIQEGFGLPYLEAASAGRPLIARKLPNVAPDLEQFGFLFPQAYDEIVVDPCLFDWESEHRRQTELFRAWVSHIPSVCREWIGTPCLLASDGAPRPVPFSRLTLTAQLEVLSSPADRSWELCMPLNPFLAEWRKAAANSQLSATPWPASCEQWLSGAAYAGRFRQLLTTKPVPDLERTAGRAAQEAFLRERLAASNLFPLLWSRTT